ncbi:MAG: hypothetical protein O9318_06855 [Hylemonella sp.]|uniref:hypothetical protein n=1 Tax=Hylemonella sp. TaxID=2066020 RepID=UPI0022C95976|nr:hypothetical protein [Hylemonella sp.]MCZ8252171.1 hypothetical protein [Hylemonella sp.]
MTKLVKTSKSLLAGMALVAGLGLAGAGSAQAGTDVFWSIAMSQPGIHVGVSNGPVLVHAPRVYVPPRVVYAPAYPVYHVHSGHGHKHWKHHHHHGHAYGHGHDRHHDRHHGRGHDRHDRDHHAHRGGGRDRHDLHMGNRR